MGNVEPVKAYPITNAGRRAGCPTSLPRRATESP